MDQTWSNVIVFVGATIVLPIAIGVIVKLLWFRRDDDDYGDPRTMCKASGTDRDPRTPPMR